MVFLIVAILVPILTFLCLPRILKYVKNSGHHNSLILIAACLLFFMSWYLPSPEIQGQQTAATTHFVGGGVFTGLVWVYIKQYLQWHKHWIIELVSLLALVSLLGVANELFELLVVNLGLANLHLADTSWDLLMNTMGALTVWVLFILYMHFLRKRQQ
jgi:hypothetical protein